MSDETGFLFFVRPRLLLCASVVGGGLALLIAWVAQHRLGIEPCAWCVIQRLIVIALVGVGILGLAVWPLAGRLAVFLTGLATVFLSATGLAAAWYQHTVAAHLLSCAFTTADRFLMQFQLSEWWPEFFEARASCAEAGQALLLGWPFELWSALWFGCTTGIGCLLLLRGFRRVC